MRMLVCQLQLALSSLFRSSCQQFAITGILTDSAIYHKTKCSNTYLIRTIKDIVLSYESTFLRRPLNPLLATEHAALNANRLTDVLLFHVEINMLTIRLP